MAELAGDALLATINVSPAYVALLDEHGRFGVYTMYASWVFAVVAVATAVLGRRGSGAEPGAGLGVRGGRPGGRDPGRDHRAPGVDLGLGHRGLIPGVSAAGPPPSLSCRRSGDGRRGSKDADCGSLVAGTARGGRRGRAGRGGGGLPADAGAVRLGAAGSDRGRCGRDDRPAPGAGGGRAAHASRTPRTHGG